MYDKETHRADITIIGAGVIGLAIAAQVAKEHREVYVLERNESFGRETSSRNSEVIHAGLYYPPGSLKTRTCVEGNRLVYEICQKSNISYRKSGKLVVATNNEEITQLEELRDNSKLCGAEGLEMLTKQRINALEPNVEAVAALYSPETGVMDSNAFMRYFEFAAREKGARIAYRTGVTGVKKLSDGYEITVENNSEPFSFQSSMVINCAGLNSDTIAALAGIDTEKAGYKLHYCKGEYFAAGNGKGKLINRQVYPVPEPEGAGVGIHATRDVNGRMRLGPNARYTNSLEYGVDEKQKDIFYKSVKRFLPFIDYEDLSPEMAGIRPKLQGPGDGFRDFVIRHEVDKGFPGLINLIGIESPGLTASPAIGSYVKQIVEEFL